MTVEIVYARRLSCGSYASILREPLGHTWVVSHRDGSILRSPRGEYWLTAEDALACAEDAAAYPTILTRPPGGQSRWEESVETRWWHWVVALAILLAILLAIRAAYGEVSL